MLTPINDALDTMLKQAQCQLESEVVSLAQALGRVLAEPVRSAVDVPPADNSAMDGYAVRFDDWHSQPSQAFAVSQRIPAGHVGNTLEPNTVARIFTGSEIPPGADAVVMQENAEREGDVVTFTNLINAGDHIRRKGQDIQAGSVVLEHAHKLRSEDLGLLASIGTTQVSVYRRLKVAVMSTGDELVEPGQSLSTGQIYNSNRYTLLGMIEEAGFEMLDIGIVEDTAESTARALLSAAEAADCVITTGGVSVGEEDHVKSQVEAHGALDLWKLAIKPGKPLAFGRVLETPFIGLPGNPAAVYVTFSLLAKPYLRRLQGEDEGACLAKTIPAIAGFSVAKPGRRQEYLRARVEVQEGQLRAQLYNNQSSGVLSSVSWANALAIVPIGQTLAEGDPIEVILLESL